MVHHWFDAIHAYNKLSRHGTARCSTVWYGASPNLALMAPLEALEPPRAKVYLFIEEKTEGCMDPIDAMNKAGERVHLRPGS